MTLSTLISVTPTIKPTPLLPAIREYVHMVTSVQVARPHLKYVLLDSLQVASVLVLQVIARLVKKDSTALILRQAFNVPRVPTVLFSQQVKL